MWFVCVLGVGFFLLGAFLNFWDQSRFGRQIPQRAPGRVVLFCPPPHALSNSLGLPASSALKSEPRFRLHGSFPLGRGSGHWGSREGSERACRGKQGAAWGRLRPRTPPLPPRRRHGRVAKLLRLPGRGLREKRGEERRPGFPTPPPGLPPSPGSPEPRLTCLPAHLSPRLSPAPQGGGTEGRRADGAASSAGSPPILQPPRSCGHAVRPGAPPALPALSGGRAAAAAPQVGAGRAGRLRVRGPGRGGSGRGRGASRAPVAAPPASQVRAPPGPAGAHVIARTGSRLSIPSEPRPPGACAFPPRAHAPSRPARASPARRGAGAARLPPASLSFQALLHRLLQEAFGEGDQPCGDRCWL